MAIRYAVANGNWSSTATWDGGTLPASSDDVYSNNFTVTIDQNITVNRLRTIANGSPAIAAGGGFSIATGVTVSITAGIAAADHTLTSGPLIGVTGSGTVTINANVTGNGGSGVVAITALSTFTGALNLNGNLTGGSNSGGFYTSHALSVAANAPATVTVTGSVTGASSSSYTSPAVKCTGTAVTTINGAVTATVIGSALGVVYVAGGTVVVNGNCTGSSASNSNAIAMDVASSQLTVNGIVTGGSATSSYGIWSNSASARTTVVGEVRGGAATTGYGVYVQAGALRLDAVLRWGTLGCAPVHSQGGRPQFMTAGTEIGVAAPSDSSWPTPTGDDIVVKRCATVNHAPSDVRAGVTYDSTGMSTGTLAVPPAASVAAGVPVDATVGTAAVKLSDIAAVQGAQIAAATSG